MGGTYPGCARRPSSIVQTKLILSALVSRSDNASDAACSPGVEHAGLPPGIWLIRGASSSGTSGNLVCGLSPVIRFRCCESWQSRRPVKRAKTGKRVAQIVKKLQRVAVSVALTLLARLPFTHDLAGSIERKRAVPRLSSTPISLVAGRGVRVHERWSRHGRPVS